MTLHRIVNYLPQSLLSCSGNNFCALRMVLFYPNHLLEVVEPIGWLDNHIIRRLPRHERERKDMAWCII
jgi:hypothetical protein